MWWPLGAAEMMLCDTCHDVPCTIMTCHVIILGGDYRWCGNLLVWYMSLCSMYYYYVSCHDFRWWPQMMWWPLGVVESKIGFSCRTHQVIQDIFFLIVSYHILIINLSCSHYTIIHLIIVSIIHCIIIQSETYSLVTRTPPFAAPKSSVAEVDPVMLSSLLAKRCQYFNYDLLSFWFIWTGLSVSIIWASDSADLWDFLWDLLWDFLWVSFEISSEISFVISFEISPTEQS